MNETINLIEQIKILEKELEKVTKQKNEFEYQLDIVEQNLKALIY